jgi:hypothetical protein
MLETFKQRIADGDKWAGVVRSHAEQDAVHEDYSQPFFNAFFQEQLEELLPKHGFQIDKINYFDYPSDHWPDEGKRHIGFVAKKV